ncbi:carbohydrate ABC transporter permease [Tenggerimyces flavus]|uniref:Carbohydrate ABC transporter permease n=1 Tax=Tenggerimyces flavus TaxID=1708749 RepID=A0ABV7YNV9_9ACTN|nr:sugar ABC transporter permease [Tenggerimyces flavus]MBM7789534.1 multiple sugar transport system permease protein [Tenggerimyces flavus]
MHDTLTPVRPEAERRASSRQKRRRTDSRVAYLFLLPWFIGLVVLTAGPILASLYLSFTDFDLLTAPRWLGFDNYQAFVDDPHFHSAIKVTSMYVILSVPLAVVFALLVAVALVGKRRGSGVYRASYYLPSLLGGSVAVTILWREIFGADGLVNQVLEKVGIIGPSWVSSPDFALYTLILLHVWQFGSPMLIFLAGLKQIPQDLYESAAVDGASAFQRFVRITVPMLTPLIFFNLVLQMINSFKAFTPAFIISGGSGGPVDSTLFYTLYLYQEGFANFHMGYASAMAWALLIVISLFTAGMFITSRYWVFYGDEEGAK